MIVCSTSLCARGFIDYLFSSVIRLRMLCRAAFSIILLIATVVAQSDGISGCGGSVKVSPGILK